MKYFITSDLTKNWIKNKSYLFEYTRNYLMMDCIEDVIDDTEAQVMPTKNALTKDSIKFYKLTPKFIISMYAFNNTVINFYNKLLEEGVNLNNVDAIKVYLEDKKRKGKEVIKTTEKAIVSVTKIFYIMQGKKMEPYKVEFTKDGFIAKLSWQQFLIYQYYYKPDKYNEEEIDKKYRMSSLEKFEDYKELFNINSTTADIRNYISQILLTENVRLGHAYYKFYELYESAEYDSILEKLEKSAGKTPQKTNSEFTR